MHIPNPSPDGAATPASDEGPGPAAAGSGAPPGIVLIVDHQLPTPDQDSGSLRLSRLVEQLVRLGRSVLFFPVNGEAPEHYAARLRDRGVAIVRRPEQQSRFLRDHGHRIGLALLCRPQPALRMIGELRDLAPQCVIAYDTVDLHFRRFGRQADLAEREGRTDRFTLRARAETSRALELLLLRASDVTLVVSEEERALLRALEPGADVRVLSNVHAPGQPGGGRPAGARVLFIGNYLHAPNVDAAHWLAREIMPRVRREVPEAVLDLIGPAAPASVTALAGTGVSVHGWVETPAPLYASARAAVAPLRYGAGVKGKVGEALEHGVPVVGTRIAFEGMGLRDGHQVLVGETAGELAAHLVRLLRDDELGVRLVRAAQPALLARFGPDAALSSLRELLALPPRRRAGTTGSGCGAPP
ncbi:glycosyltransferase [Streptomyces sp. NPDC048392]|uniref:glycosyltransferase n=1 Tax=Streptomyces sp. NPDC048392 TaxID=3365543 RepID=UPI0037151FAF